MSAQLQGTYRTQCDEFVHLSRVEEVEDVNLVQNHGSSRDEWRTTHVPVCIVGLEEETRELSSPHC